MKSFIIPAILFLSCLSLKAQAPQVESLEVFTTCINELQKEITHGKKVIIEDFNLNIRQKDILVYGPYNVSDQYLKIDYVIYSPKPTKVTAEFELYLDDDGLCTGVMFHDFVY